MQLHRQTVALPRAHRAEDVAQLGLAFLLTMAVLVATYLVAPFTGTAYWLSNLPRVLLLPAVLAWTLGAVAAASLLTRWRISDQPQLDLSRSTATRTPMGASTVGAESR